MIVQERRGWQKGEYFPFPGDLIDWNRKEKENIPEIAGSRGYCGSLGTELVLDSFLMNRGNEQKESQKSDFSMKRTNTILLQFALSFLWFSRFFGFWWFFFSFWIAYLLCVYRSDQRLSHYWRVHRPIYTSELDKQLQVQQKKTVFCVLLHDHSSLLCVDEWIGRFISWYRQEDGHQATSKDQGDHW